MHRVLSRIRPQHLALLAAAAFVLADVAIVAIGVRGDFGFDFKCCYQQAGQRLLEDRSTLYDWSTTYTFRYSPWAALLFTPLAPLSETQATLAWLIVKLAVLVAVAVWYARPITRDWRPAAVLAVAFFPPIWHDLVLGNVSVFTVAVLLALLRWTDARGGALFGLLLLLAPKPHLVPIAIWLLVRRPRAAIATLGVAAVGVAIGVLVFGTEPWADYLATFREPLGRDFTANVGWSGLVDGPAGVAFGIGSAILVLLLALTRAGDVGFGMAIASGVLLGPYTFIHYLAGLLVAAEPMLRARPRLLAPFPWLLVIFPLIPIWVLVFALTLHLGLAPGWRARHRG